MVNKALPVLTILGCVVAGSAMANEDLAKSKNCLVCHSVDAKRIGPSYKDVAQKYAGKADAEAMLIEKVLKGGGGNWGGMPMPPNPQVSPEEAKTLVQWILGLK
jgi:cytochrome c